MKVEVLEKSKELRKLKVVIFVLFSITIMCFSTGCSSTDDSNQGNSNNFLLDSFDIKDKEVTPVEVYSNYDRYGIVSGGSSDSQNDTVLSDNTVSGGTSNFISKYSGTGQETVVTTKNKNAQKAVAKALKNNEEYSKTTKKRKEIVNYALQWVGNKYVYGGTSLTNGTDCSGFTMSVMKHFGIHLDRTSAEQRKNGKSVEKPKPGDLICYYGHVGLYIGDNQIVHASNSKPYPEGGIKITSNYKYRSVAGIRDVISK